MMRGFVADGHGMSTSLRPRRAPARRPNIRIHAIDESSPRHRAETVRDQVDRSFENWEFRTVFEKMSSPVFSAELLLI